MVSSPEQNYARMSTDTQTEVPGKRRRGRRRRTF